MGGAVGGAVGGKVDGFLIVISDAHSWFGSKTLSWRLIQLSKCNPDGWLIIESPCHETAPGIRPSPRCFPDRLSWFEAQRHNHAG